MRELTCIKNNVYVMNDLLHMKFSSKVQVALTVNFPTSRTRRYGWIRYFEDKYTMSLNTPSPPPIDIDPWAQYQIHELIGDSIKELMRNRYSDTNHPYVLAIRIDLSLGNLYILVRTIYGTRACIDRFGEVDGSRFT